VDHQEPHAWENGVSRVIEALPDDRAVGQLEYQVPRVEQHGLQGSAVVVDGGGDGVLLRPPESVALGVRQHEVRAVADGERRGRSRGGWAIAVGDPHDGAVALRDAVEPDRNVQARRVGAGAGRGEEAECKDAAFGDEQVAGVEWPCACQLVIGFADTNHQEELEQEDENGKAGRAHILPSVFIDR